MSLDSPTYNNYSGILIFAESKEENKNTNQYSIFKLSKTFESDKSMELVYTHEFNNTAHSVQSIYTWPWNNQIDIKFGGQIYWGERESNLEKLKRINSVFISLKNYFDF
jgi:hypothetical protein